MLTGDLIRVRVRKKEMHPRFIDPTAPRLVAWASDLVTMTDRAVQEQWNRGRIQKTTREIAGTSTDHKLLHGLAKVLLDRGDFETVAPLDPIELRAKVFAHAAATGPLARHPGSTGRRTAADVLGEVAKEIGAEPAVMARALYADLKDEQVLTRCDSIEPQALLQRYNVALVQAVLLKATWMRVTLQEPEPKRIRQLLRYLKFNQLMYRVETTPDAIEFAIDGPESLLRLSTRYGMQLANFFPAVLLQTGPWRMQAEVLWGRKRKLKKQLSVDPSHQLVSHYRDTGTWKSRTERWFEERFAQLESSWQMRPGEIIDLGAQQMLVPDFTFTSGTRTAHLDIVGFWRRGYLRHRIEATPDNVILAVSTRLSGETQKLPKTLASRVISFAEVIPPKKVVARLEEVAR